MAQAILAGNLEMKHFHIILEGKLLTHSKKYSHLLALSESRQASKKELSLLKTDKSASTAQQQQQVQLKIETFLDGLSTALTLLLEKSVRLLTSTPARGKRTCTVLSIF